MPSAEGGSDAICPFPTTHVVGYNFPCLRRWSIGDEERNAIEGTLPRHHFAFHGHGAHAPEEGVFNAFTGVVVAEVFAEHRGLDEMFHEVA